ncbi:MAG: 2-hydroxyacid dehydrogenase [Alphaproteobacteria bacterium]|nr:2-hydroxyacid dehydrogenase [Alphaproteobacteria bacterium]
MTVELLQIGPLMPRLMEALAKSYRVHRLWEAADKDKLLREIGPSVRAIATDGHRGASSAVMAALPKLEIISCFGVGVDAVDLPAAKARGVKVTNTPDVLNDDVADLALGLMLAVYRTLPLADRFVREGRWLQGPLPLNRKLTGQRLGIVGLGRIGLAVAKRAAGFDMSIAYHNRKRRTDVPFAFHADAVSLARNVDVLCLTCPGGAETRHLVNAQVLDAMGPQGVLINVARGSVVDEPALVKALAEKRIAAAGLDVFEAEPRAPEALFKLDNVVLTPHIASGTTQTRAAMADLVTENLRRHFAGEPLKTPLW